MNGYKTFEDIHADDYGLSVSNADAIIDGIKRGKLDSISIIPTMDAYDECVEKLKGALASRKEKEKLLPVTVHIDLVDGRAKASNPRPGLYTDDKGLIISSWGKLFFWSCTSLGQKRQKIKETLSKEIEAQIVKVKTSLMEIDPRYNSHLRLDSHMHTHMIPIVADSMWMALDTLGISPEFVRVAREPLFPFIKRISLYRTYSGINIIKNILLNLLSGRLENQCRKRNVSFGLMWGLVMSGHMDKMRISRCYNDMLWVAKRRGKVMEILFHPSGIKKEELDECHNKPDIYEFYLSKNRHIEMEAIENRDCWE